MPLRMIPRSLLAAGGVGLLLCAATAAWAIMPLGHNQLAVSERAQGWKLLFDGKSTTAWRSYLGNEFPAAGWKIEDNALKCEKSNGRPNGGGGDIVTRDSFTDFELAWQWRISPGGNTGLKYFIVRRPALGRAMFKGDDGRALVGLEYQMLDDDAHPDAKNGPSRTSGALYLLIAPSGKTLRPVGQYNDSRLVVRGTHVEHWLNGEKVVAYELGSAALGQALAASKYSGVPGFADPHRQPTPILLQDHGFDAWFRNIKILDLTPGHRPAAPAAPAAPAPR